MYPNSITLLPSVTTPYLTQHLERANLSMAMAGLSEHTQRPYRRWIARYLSDVLVMCPESFDLDALDLGQAISALNAANFSAWLGSLKASGLGKQSIGQARAAVVWLAQFVADAGRVDHSLAAGLSRVKQPRAESGQRAGTWLTTDEVRTLLDAVKTDETINPTMRARNVAMLTLLITCGLRCSEVVDLTWGDITKQGPYAVIMVHGKGEKFAPVKLPVMAIKPLEFWRELCYGGEPTRPIFLPVVKGGRAVITRPLSARAVWSVVSLAAKAAGLPKLSPHDLRRTMARGSYESGATLEEIRQVLRHANIATTERYVNSALELDRAATDIWADKLQGGDEYRG